MIRKGGLTSFLVPICLMILTACNSGNGLKASLPTVTATEVTSQATLALIPSDTPGLPKASSRTAAPTRTPPIFDAQALAWFVACQRQENETVNHVTAFNPDGSARKDLLSYPLVKNTCQVAATPTGKGALIAVVTAPMDENDFPSPLSLSIIQIPEGKVFRKINLINPETVKDPQGVLNPAVLEAVGFNSGMSWSPDGNLLAFIAARDGPTADVYIYNKQNGEVTRISQEPDQANGLTWSLDGQFVVYQQVEAFGGAGSISKAVWAANVAARTSRRLLDTGSSGLTFAGWSKNGSLIAHPWGGMPGMPEAQSRVGWLQSIDPIKGTVDYLIPRSSLPANSILNVAYNPGDEWIGLAVEYPADVKLTKALDGSMIKSIDWKPQQFWAITVQGGDPKMLFSEVSRKGIGIDITPSGRSGHWIARFEYEQFDLSLNGKGATLGEGWFAPAISPDHAWLAFYEADTMVEGEQPGLRLVSPDGTTRHIVTEEPVSGVTWQPDGKGLLFISNEKLLFLPSILSTPIEVQSSVNPYLFAPNITPSVWLVSSSGQGSPRP